MKLLSLITLGFGEEMPEEVCGQPLTVRLALTLLLVTLSGFQAVNVTVNTTSHAIFSLKAAETSGLALAEAML